MTALLAEDRLQRFGRDRAGRSNLSVRERLLRRGLRRTYRRDRVVDLLHTCGECRRFAHAADVHEVDLRLVEEEVIVQRRHLETVVQGGTHGRVDFVLEQNRVAHHHQTVMRRGEGCP